MTQELTTTTNAGAVDSQRRARVAQLHASITRDEHYRDALPAPLTPDQRKGLEAYRRDLHDRLRPASMATAEKAMIGKAISALLQGYVGVYVPDVDAAMRAYVALLEGQPAWAILEALDDFRNGRVYDLDANGDRKPFPVDKVPSAPRILDQAKKHTDAIVEERGRVIRLLAVRRVEVPEPSPEMRERVGELMRGLANDFGSRAAKDKAAERENIRAEADAARDRARRIMEDARARRQETSPAG